MTKIVEKSWVYGVAQFNLIVSFQVNWETWYHGVRSDFFEILHSFFVLQKKSKIWSKPNPTWHLQRVVGVLHKHVSRAHQVRLRHLVLLTSMLCKSLFQSDSESDVFLMNISFSFILELITVTKFRAYICFENETEENSEIVYHDTFTSSSLLLPKILSLMNLICCSSDHLLNLGRGLVVTRTKLSSWLASVTHRQ